MQKIIIAIDGYSSCGKSTLAKQLAKALDYVYIDSGAMYRAITLYFIENNVDLNNSSSIRAALKHIDIEFRTVDGKQHLFLNNKDVESKIRSIEIAKHVSEVSTLLEVRNFAVHLQQKMGKQNALVMDGRDIGTTVFPDAALKLFMTADVDVRAQRRFEELNDDTLSFEEVKQNLLHRDHIDSTREISPLRQAVDAVVIDNSNLTLEEQFELAMRLVREKTL